MNPSLRPPSSSSSAASLARPGSSASIRPTSRASYRPKSRQQKLTNAKLLPFCEDVVRRVLGEPDDETEARYHELVDWSMKQLGMEGASKAAVVLDIQSVDKMVRGHVEKARIKSQDTLANSLVKSYEQLKEHAEGQHDLDDEIKKSRLPAHMQFLLALSSAPEPSTLTYASIYLNALENPPDPSESDQLTWKKILEDDPYEGDHWVGVPGGIPAHRKRRPASIYSDEADNENLLDGIDIDIDTSPSLSPLNSDDLALDDDETDSASDVLPLTSVSIAPTNTTLPDTGHRPLYTTYAYRKEIEDLKSKQYWHHDWKMDPELAARVQQRGTFDIGDASTLGPTLQRVLPTTQAQLPLELVLSVERYIQEQDAVRDVLMALQGRENILYDRHFSITKTTPRILHFSLTSQHSLLSTIGSSCRAIQRLRQFASAIMHQSSAARSTTTVRFTGEKKPSTLQGKMTRTLEAFADAIDAEIRILEVWCAEREEDWIRALGGYGYSNTTSTTATTGTPILHPDANPNLGLANKEKDNDGKDKDKDYKPEPGVVVSLLGTEKAFRDRFEDSFQVILDVVIQVIGHAPPGSEPSTDSPSSSEERKHDLARNPNSHFISWVHLPTRSPSSTTALLLDTLFSAVQQHLERGDNVTAEALMRVFVRSAEPVWGMVGRWIAVGFDVTTSNSNSLPGSTTGGGAGRGLEEEFFIESNGLGVEMGVLGLLDPDFWREGYSLRESTISILHNGSRGSESLGESGLGLDSKNNDDEDSAPAGKVNNNSSIPTFLRHVAETVLESGKATGLLKVLGMDPTLMELAHGVDEDVQNILHGEDWVSFQSLIASNSASSSLDVASEAKADGVPSLFSVSIDRLSRIIYDKLTPHGQANGALLAKVIMEECDFWSHLRVIQSLYMMRRGDIISDFTDVLFAKMDSKQDWTDFHFLNTAFSDIVTASNTVSTPAEAIEIHLIRLSYQGSSLSKPSSSTIPSRTLKSLDHLSLEYAVPFPLTYIFTPNNMQIYNEIFVFLLQIRRAKSLLEKILVRGAASGGKNPNSGLKAFYAMRSRLSWFINVFLNFLTTYVIQIQALALHKALTVDRQSFDQMIKTHEDHLKIVQSRCLLQPKTTALYRAVLSIFDMTANFSDLFSVFAGDVTMHDISSHSVVLKHHRSRRQRRRRKNVIGFSFQSRDRESSSSSDSEADHDNEDEVDYSYSASMNTTTFEERDDLFTKINKMSTDLDGLVKFVRRGVETLAGGTGDASATFGILAFSLEDWDL